MSLIHTCELNHVNPFDYLTELQKHANELSSHPEGWMPWNYQNTPSKELTSPSKPLTPAPRPVTPPDKFRFFSSLPKGHAFSLPFSTVPPIILPNEAEAKYDEPDRP